ncbi:response regulator transcription factor [Ruminococcus sp. NK3A76]|uniref:response regulator transcription factor n=1 Tax=Ruminococcus sp. NK3A76 TaxID=877411 RepID=UPI000490768C|nr:response regulator transcription factor [Ruminococcus sp. NK3A76]
MTKILIIEDDTSIGNMLEKTLTNEGYETCRAYSGTEALLLLDRTKPALILLDLMLPGLSGEELLPRIKDTPVIVMSAKGDPATKVDMLLGGAYDYITKPFDISELLARITVALRKHSESGSGIISCKGLTLDTQAHTVTADGEPIKLTRTEFAILKLLMQSPDKVIAKLTILDRISEDTPDCTESSLKQHISNLRKKLKAADGQDRIEAVWGIGFKLR